MSERQAVGLIAMHGDTPRDREAIQQLVQALPGATAGELDEETGAFEVHVEADSHEDALQAVFDAIAAAGVDDHVVFAEHPDVPRHWRRASAAT
jgi:hypothetical protein